MPSFITAPSSAPIRSPMNLELASFKKSIKREASAYSVLKDKCFIDKFQRDLLITAKSHDVSEILDPSYSPGPSPEERELFEAKQVFMYKVFNETVRKYLRTTDAQAVWKEYSDYMTTSSKGASEKRKLTHYVTNTVLDNQFRGTTQQFVLHFNEQFRRSQQNLTEMAEFANIKIVTNINEWLNEIAFVTSKMSDPIEPQTFQQAWWHPDLAAREKW